MFLIKNARTFPVVIRDLSFHVAGNSIVDLSEFFPRDSINKSVDLRKLLENDKIQILKQSEEKKSETHPPPVVVEKVVHNNHNDELIEKLNSFEELLKNIALGGVKQETNHLNLSEIESELKAKILSDNPNKIEANFDDIGEKKKRKDDVDDLINILEDL